MVVINHCSSIYLQSSGSNLQVGWRDTDKGLSQYAVCWTFPPRKPWINSGYTGQRFHRQQFLCGNAMIRQFRSNKLQYRKFRLDRSELRCAYIIT